MRLLAEIVQQFAEPRRGMSIAIPSPLTLLSFGCVAILLGACLVTDAIELPSQPNTPPRIVSWWNTACEECDIMFNAAKDTELRIPLEIRNQDPSEVLKVRWQVIINGLPAPGTDGRPLAYACPEREELRGTRIPYTLSIQAMEFPRNSCSRVDVAVSASFKSCLTDPSLFDVTTGDDEDERAIKSFRVWEISLDPLGNQQRAQEALMTCPAKNYLPPTSTTPLVQ